MPATAHQSTIKILYGESDEHTLSAQAAEIAKAGHHVTTALDRHGVQEALLRDAFDLVILGATLSKRWLPPSRRRRRHGLQPEHAPDPRAHCNLASARGRPLSAKHSHKKMGLAGWRESHPARPLPGDSELPL